MTYALWELRTAQNLTLRQLEKKSGVSKSQINDIENGKTNPTIETLLLLAKALKVEIPELFRV